MHLKFFSFFLYGLIIFTTLQLGWLTQLVIIGLLAPSNWEEDVLDSGNLDCVTDVVKLIISKKLTSDI